MSGEFIPMNDIFDPPFVRVRGQTLASTPSPASLNSFISVLSVSFSFLPVCH